MNLCEEVQTTNRNFLYEKFFSYFVLKQLVTGTKFSICFPNDSNFISLWIE